MTSSQDLYFSATCDLPPDYLRNPIPLEKPRQHCYIAAITPVRGGTRDVTGGETGRRSRRAQRVGAAAWGGASELSPGSSAAERDRSFRQNRVQSPADG